MKHHAHWAKAGLFFGALALALPLSADTGKVPPPTPTPTAPNDEEAPDPSTITLPGTVMERPDGKGFLSLTVDSGVFKLNFYDVNKQAIAPDVTRAAARWNPKQKYGEDRSVLNLTKDGQALQGAKFVQPPYPIMVYLTLLSPQGVGVESHNVNFRP